jgi:O-antigen/teichoic acid export membrane protein
MEKNENKGVGKILSKNIFFNFSYSLINKIFTFIFIIYLARILLPEQYGYYGIVFSVIIIFSYIEQGMNNAIIKYVASNIDDKKIIQEYIHYLLYIKLIYLAIVSISIILFAKSLSINVFHKEELIFPFIYSAVYFILFALTEFFVSVFMAFNDFKIVPIKEMIFQISRLILVFSIVFLISNSVSNVFIGLFLAYLITFIFLIYNAKKKYSFIFKYRKIESERKIEARKYIILLAITMLGYPIFMSVDSIMLGIFVDAEYVGFYRAAHGIVIAIAEILIASYALFPIFSSVNEEKLKAIFDKAFKLLMVVCIPAALALPFFAWFIIHNVYGDPYILSIYPLYVLSLLIIMQIGFLYTALFTARGKQKIPMIAMLVALGINIILNFVFIKYMLEYSQLYAVIGASIATVLSNIVYFIIIARAAKKEFGIITKFGYVIKPLIASIVMDLFIFLVLKYYSGSLQIILEFLVGVIVYFLILFLIKGLTKEDILEIKEMFIKGRLK